MTASIRIFVRKLVQATSIAAAMLSFFIAAPARAQNALPAAAPAVLASGTCAPLISRFVVAQGGENTVSTSFVNVPLTSVKFTQGGKKPGCVLVTFSAEAGANANEEMLVQPILDNTTPCKQFNIFVSSTATGNGGSFAMTYACPDVAPGKHQVRMQFASKLGGSVSLGTRTTVVQFVP